MATITISFTTIPGITSYAVCYKPVTEVAFTCITVSSSPVVITENIQCGVAYDVSVRTNCPPGVYSSDQSISVVTTATALECPAVPCISYTVSTTSAQGQTSAYIDCFGDVGQVTVGGASGYDATTFCAREGSVILGNDCQLAINGPCGDNPEGATVTVEGASGYMEPCVGGTLDDYMGASVYLNTAVTVDTIFNVIVKWSAIGSGCTFPYEQSLSVEVLAGQTSSNFVACSQGVYISSGANICSALVTGHNNTVDTIILP